MSENFSHVKVSLSWRVCAESVQNDMLVIERIIRKAFNEF